MKKLIIGLVFGLVSSGCIANAPFGLRVGMSLSEVKKVAGNPTLIDTYNYRFSKVPVSHSSFVDYGMIITPKHGLCKIFAFGEALPANSYGDSVKREFTKIEKSISSKCGEPLGVNDYLKTGSIWSNPNEWMMGLYKEERKLNAGWDVGEKNGVDFIALKAGALNSGKGILSLTYELSNIEGCLAELSSASNEGL